MMEKFKKGVIPSTQPEKHYGAFTLLALLVYTSFLVSCIPGTGAKGSARKDFLANGIKNNAPSTVALGYGRILEDSPIVLSGNLSLPASFNPGQFLKKGQQYISDGESMVASCSSPDGTYSVSDCYKVLHDANALPLAPRNGKWAFPPTSQEFWEVHTFGHLRRGVERFHNALSYAYTLSQSLGVGYLTAISSNLYSQLAFWNDSKSLVTYSHCEDLANAYFSPAQWILCFGTDFNNTGILFAQDSTVIYHELAHAMVHVFSNQRNMASTAPLILQRSDLGYLAYDEAAAINEGIADYFSYVINGRYEFGEWALGRFFDLARPISEESYLHTTGAVGTGENYRLSYPTFLNYEANAPASVVEDIHNAGQIASHYLVALTNDFKSLCYQDHETATNNVIYLLIQTLGELGDLTSKGSDNSPNTHNVNMISDDGTALDWTRMVNPANYRRFFQTFAKHLVQVFTSTARCSTGLLTQDRIEQLLDQYGLLLFKTYNLDGNGYQAAAVTQPGHAGPLLSVSPLNRTRSTLISKELLIFDPVKANPKAYIVDDADQIGSIITNIIASGMSYELSNIIPRDLGYNNGNGNINRGEIVGIALNLYNNSNSIMGGVQILANDWDHAKLESGELKLCNTFEDKFPLDSEGAADLTGDLSTVSGSCRHITKLNGGEPEEVLAPVCFVQYRADNETQWVSQDSYRQDIGLAATQCLGGSADTSDCLIRAVKGAEHAYLSKIEPQKNFLDSLASGGQSSDVVFNAGNIVLFEINPWIPPGTTFDCRFRARFTNCDDCYHDSTNSNDDYLDYEYAGGDPYRILHLQFTVNN